MFLNLGFSYSWWNYFYNLEFDENFYLNPDNKIITAKKMSETLTERFSWYDQVVNKDRGVSSSDNIDIEPFGHRFFPAMMGCKIKYSKAQPPWAEHNLMSVEQVLALENMTAEKFRNSDNVRLITDQVKYVREKYRSCSSQQNLGSVINTGIYIRGLELFSDYIENPQVVHKLYQVITSVMENAYDYFSELDGRKSDIGLGNCTVCMISPEQYANFNRVYDAHMMEKARKLGVKFNMHQDSNVTPYIKAYQPLDYINIFDVGCDTNIREFRKGFPNVIINTFVYSGFLCERTPEQIERDLRTLIEEAGGREKIGFSCYDIDETISDDKVAAIMRAVI